MTDTTTAIPQPLPQVVQPTAPKGQRVELGAGWVTPKGDISIALNAVNLSVAGKATPTQRCLPIPRKSQVLNSLITNW